MESFLRYREDEPATVGVIGVEGDFSAYRTGEATTDGQSETDAFLEVVWFHVVADILVFETIII